MAISVTRNKSQKGGVILLSLIIFLSSCGTRRHDANSSKEASGAVNAMSHLKSKHLYRFINNWMGVRYKFGGLDRQGIDCSGFTYLLQKEIYGINLPRSSSDQAGTIRRKNFDNLKEGDLVFFSFSGKNIDHVGVYLNNGFFVHASTTRGVIVDDLSLPAYQRTLIKAGSVRN